MKKALIDKTGKTKSVNEISLTLPACIRSFDDKYSFLNITDKEYKILCEDTQSSRRDLLVSQLLLALRHDYKNYLESNTKEQEEVSILGFVSHSMRSMTVERYESMLMSVEEADMLGEESLLEYFSHFSSSSLKNVVSMLGKVIDVTILHSFPLSTEDELVAPCVYDSPLTEVLLNRISLASRSLKTIASKLYVTKDIERKIAVLAPFASMSFARSLEIAGLSDNNLAIEVLKSLYQIGESSRSEVYRIIAILEELKRETISPAPDDNFATGFVRTTVQNKPETPFTITLGGYTSNDRVYTFEAEDACCLRVPGEAREEIVGCLKADLQAIYQEYCSDQSNLWKEQALTDIDNYKTKNPSFKNGWQMFYADMIDHYKSFDAFLAQKCFMALVANNVSPLKPLDFTQDLIIGLIDTLRKNQTMEQSGLYEGMFKINYIKERKSEETPISMLIEEPDYSVSNRFNNSFKAAMDYIDCIFEPDYFEKEEYVPIVRSAIKVILADPELQELLLQSVRGFNRNFNIKIVYRVIGHFFDRKTPVFNVDMTKLDRAMSRANNQVASRSGEGLPDRTKFFKFVSNPKEKDPEKLRKISEENALDLHIEELLKKVVPQVP